MRAAFCRLQQMKKKKENIFHCLARLEAREIKRELLTGLEAWFILTLLSLILIKLASSLGIEKTIPEEEWNSPGHWAWQAVAFSALLWFFRGKEIKFRVPSFTMKSWLANVLAFIVIVFLLARLPPWLSLPICWALSTGDTVLERLLEAGREKAGRGSNTQE